MDHKSALVWISFLAFVYSTSAVDVVFKHYYGGDTFDAEIETIYAQKDMIGFPGWEMLLTFDQPLTQLVLYDHEVVETFAGRRQFVIKNRSWSHLKAGDSYKFTFAGKYSGGRPTVGTAVWYGDSVGESTTTLAGPTGPTESQAPTTTTTPQPTTTNPPITSAPGECLGAAEVVNQWTAGYQMTITIPVTQNVREWSGTITFSHPTTLLDIWTSDPRQPVGNTDGTIYPIANKKGNAQKSPGSRLRLNFIVRYRQGELTDNEPCVQLIFNNELPSTTTTPTTTPTPTTSTTSTPTTTASTTTTTMSTITTPTTTPSTTTTTTPTTTSTTTTPTTTTTSPTKTTPTTTTPTSTAAPTTDTGPVTRPVPEGCMGSTIIVDTAWNEGYSAIVIIPVSEDYNGWSGTITFSHSVLSVTAWSSSTEDLSADGRVVSIANLESNGEIFSGNVLELGFVVYFDEQDYMIDPCVQIEPAVTTAAPTSTTQPITTTTTTTPTTTTPTSTAAPTTDTGPVTRPVPDGCMGSTIIVDTAWNEGYSAIVIIPVTEDYNGWSGTITFSHPVLSVTAWSSSTEDLSADGRVVSIANLESNGEIFSGNVLELGFVVYFEEQDYTIDPCVQIEPAVTTAAPSSTAQPTTTTTIPTTTTNSGPVTAPVPTGCDGVMMIVDSSWNEGYSVIVLVPVMEDINEWHGTITFSHPIVNANVYTSSTSDLSADGRELYISNLSTNGQVFSGNVLEVGFVAYFEEQDYIIDPCVRIVYGPPPTTASSTTAMSTTLESTTAQPTTPEETTQQPATTSTLAPGEHDYNKAIELSMLFYEAQRSGPLPADNRITWRGDSSLNDGSNPPPQIDLTGGWHDAGDHVKFGLPMSASATTLIYGMLFFEDGYKSARQYEEALRQIRWPLDYFMKCFQQPDRFYAQVGNGDIDHAVWTRPEDMEAQGVARPKYYVGADKSGGADVMGESAAAMAAGSILFKNIDAEYSMRLLNDATALYALAKQYPGTYNDAIPDGATFYPSNDYVDELAHAAGWLAYEAMLFGDAATMNQYLTEAADYLNDGAPWAVDWSDKRGLANLILYHITKDTRYRANIESFVDGWRSKSSVDYTPGGLAYRLEWGSNRYAANAANLALLAAKCGINPADYARWAQGQIDYMLGDNPLSISYQVGYPNDNAYFPRQPHHKAASCPPRSEKATCGWDDYSNGADNPYILYGALVGGPNQEDMYSDVRSDFQSNEVTTDYNAGFTSALAGLSYFRVHPI